MDTIRSLLFVPGDSARKFERARISGADALILDLEDAVAPEAKAEARATIAEMLANRAESPPLFVRVNAFSTGLLMDDLHAVAGKCDGIVLPKCSGIGEVRQLSHYLDAFERAAGWSGQATRILPIVGETAASLFSLGEYCAAANSRLAGLIWGAEDLAVDLGATRKRSGEGFSGPFRLARNLCLFAAASAGVAAIDTAYPGLDDPGGLAREAQEARHDGFQAKITIHPSQVPIVNDVFSAAQDEKEWAQMVVAAFANNPSVGALRIDGHMIDQPHLKLARRILSAAGQA